MPQEQPSIERRRDIFKALVEAQDQGVSVETSRRDVAGHFGISEAQLRRIEKEGLDNEWPPLDIP